MDQTLAPVLDAVMRAAAIKPGERVIDIGCGAGTSTLLAAEDTGTAGSVCGLDISATLLDAARLRAEGLEHVSFELADAQTHVFEAPAFDCLISRFGLMFFDDPPAAFANMARALPAGGRMAFATWGAIPGNPFFTMPARLAAEVIGVAPKSDPDAPGPLSLRDTELLHRLLAQAGMEQIEIQETEMFLTPAGSASDVADMLCDIGSAQRILLHFDASDEQRAQLCEVLTEALLEYATNDGIRVPALINVVTASKPA